MRSRMLELSDSDRSGKKLLNSRYVLKVELTKFADRLDEDYERKKVVNGRFLR